MTLLLLGAAQQLAGDDEALDVAGAFVDLHPFGVAQVALDRVVVGIAPSAVHQDRLVRGAQGGLGGEEFGGGSGPTAGLALVLQPGGMVHQVAGRVHVGGHVSQRRLDHLEVADALAERAPLPRKGHGGVQAGLGDAECAGGDTEAAMVQGAHGDAKSVPGRAQEIARRNAAP